MELNFNILTKIIVDTFKKFKYLQRYLPYLLIIIISLHNYYLFKEKEKYRKVAFYLLLEAPHNIITENTENFYKRCIGSVFLNDVIYFDTQDKHFRGSLHSFLYYDQNSKTHIANGVFTHPELHYQKIHKKFNIRQWFNTSRTQKYNHIQCLEGFIKSNNAIPDINCFKKDAYLTYCYNNEVGIFIIDNNSKYDLSASDYIVSLF